jgi:hypothetical protein
MKRGEERARERKREREGEGGKGKRECPLLFGEDGMVYGN